MGERLMRMERTIGYIKDLTERIRSEMQSIPRTINPANVVESIEVLLKFLNSIIRIKAAIKIAEAAEQLEIPPREKLQIKYYTEILKEYLTSIYNSAIRIVETLTKTFADESFEQIVFKEIQGIMKEIVRPHLAPELLEAQKAKTP